MIHRQKIIKSRFGFEPDPKRLFQNRTHPLQQSAALCLPFGFAAKNHSLLKPAAFKTTQLKQPTIAFKSPAVKRLEGASTSTDDVSR